MPKYTYVQGDDWDAIYKDGRLLAEDHSFSVRRVFKLLNIEVEMAEVKLGWLDKHGRFAENLADVELL